MKKVTALLIIIFLCTFIISAQKPEKCKVKDNSNVPKYKTAHWERNENAKPPTLLIFIALKSKEIEELNLLALAKHLEKKYCKEAEATFWIFNDFDAALRPFDDVGAPWKNTIRSSIMAYSFDRDTKENSFSYNLKGGVNFVGYDSKKIYLESPTPLKP